MNKEYWIIGLFFSIVGIILISGCVQENNKERIIDQVATNCNSDSDCLIIDKNLGFSCCWAGSCSSVDLSRDKWIAVNIESFLELRKLSCPSGDIWIPETSEEKTQKDQACGDPPGCPNLIINDNFIARCIDNVCEKVPK